MLASKLKTMVSISQKDYMKAIFGPLCEVAGRNDLLPKLKTAPLPKERSKGQYTLLKCLRAVEAEPALLLGDSFVFMFTDGVKEYFCVQIEGLSDRARNVLSESMQRNFCHEVLLDEAVFMFIAVNVRGINRIRSEYMATAAAENELDIIGDDVQYVGHEFYHVVELFKEIAVFEIDKNSLLSGSNNTFMANCLCMEISEYRSTKISASIIGVMRDLWRIKNIDQERIHMALTSSHWSHIFLEMYKFIEAAFYLPWMIALKEMINVEAGGLFLFQKCWNAKEIESICKLFEMIPDEIVRTKSILTVKCFKELDAEGGRSAFGRRVYRIRNQSVHRFDRDYNETLSIDGSEWEIIIKYVIDIVIHLYEKYAHELSCDVANNVEA